MRKKISLFFLIVLLLRAVLLEADPSILLDSGQVGDEGYWLYNARNLNLFGSLAIDDFYHDLAAAPIFSIFAYLSFAIFGVGFWQGRLVSALAGLATVVIAHKIAKGLGVRTATAALVLLGTNILLLLHNRLAVPESLAILGTTLAIFFWLREKPVFSGIVTTCALFAKATVFLFIPSILAIILLSWFEKRVKAKAVKKFLLSFSLSFVLINLFLLGRWGEKIILIYATFGSWYMPTSFVDLWRNIVSFFIHPFWGSPFNFAIATLTLVNITAGIFSGSRVRYLRKVMFAWLAGSLVLAPFMSQITNARLLPLLVPMSILAADTLVDIRQYFVSIKNLRIKKLNGLLIPVATLILSFPIATIAGKFFLAIVKRVGNNEQIVYLLPQLSIVLTIILTISILAFLSRKGFDFLVKFNVTLLLALPLISFLAVFSAHLSFFKIVNLDRTVVTGLGVVAFLTSYIGLLVKKEVSGKYLKTLLIMHIIFTAFGILTFFVSPSHNFALASRALAKWADNKTVLGFLGHELSLENRAKPLYFTPRLNFVSDVNSNWRQYNPEILLVTKVFDGRQVIGGPWPEESDIDKRLTLVDSFDLSRTFLTAKRAVLVEVFKIEN